MSAPSPTVVPMRDSSSSEMPVATSAATSAPAASASAKGSKVTPRHGFMPLLLGLLAVTAWLGVQAWQLEQDRQQLLATQATMAPTLDKAGQLRRSLDLLAADTQRLADGGNGNARLLVDELRKRGITINPNSPPVQPAASATR